MLLHWIHCCTAIPGAMTFLWASPWPTAILQNCKQWSGSFFTHMFCELGSLFQVMLNWRDRDQMLSFIGLEGLAIESLMASTAISKFDLFLFVTDLGDEVWLEMEYNSDIFDEDRIARMLVHYQTLLQAVTADPGASIAQLPLLTEAEYLQIVFDWNRTERSYPKEECLDELIEEQIERTPDAVAVVFEGEQLTYRQLGDRANDLACYLRELGVGRNTLVAICVERSLDILVGLDLHGGGPPRIPLRAFVHEEHLLRLEGSGDELPSETLARSSDGLSRFNSARYPVTLRVWSRWPRWMQRTFYP